MKRSAGRWAGNGEGEAEIAGEGRRKGRGPERMLWLGNRQKAVDKRRA